MLKENVTSGSIYEGYCIDLIEKIATMCNFTYTIKPISDGLYGSLDETGKWTGLIGELIDKVVLNSFINS